MSKDAPTGWRVAIDDEAVVALKRSEALRRHPRHAYYATDPVEQTKEEQQDYANRHIRLTFAIGEFAQQYFGMSPPPVGESNCDPIHLSKLGPLRSEL